MYKRQAGAQGHQDAQYNLGVMYAQAQGVKQDDVESFKWFEKAAKQGHISVSYTHLDVNFVEILWSGSRLTSHENLFLAQIGMLNWQPLDSIIACTLYL